MFQDKGQDIQDISLEELQKLIPEVQQQGRVVQELEIARSVVTALKSQAGVNI